MRVRLGLNLDKGEIMAVADIGINPSTYAKSCMIKRLNGMQVMHRFLRPYNEAFKAECTNIQTHTSQFWYVSFTADSLVNNCDEELMRLFTHLQDIEGDCWSLVPD